MKITKTLQFDQDQVHIEDHIFNSNNHDLKFVNKFIDELDAAVQWIVSNASTPKEDDMGDRSWPFYRDNRGWYRYRLKYLLLETSIPRSILLKRIMLCLGSRPTTIGDNMAKIALGIKTKSAFKGTFAPLKTNVRLTPGKAIRIYREAQGFSQSELADRAGLKQTTISGLEHDRITLGIDRAKVIARVLSVHPSVLAFPSWDVERDSAA